MLQLVGNTLSTSWVCSAGEPKHNGYWASPGCKPFWILIESCSWWHMSWIWTNKTKHHSVFFLTYLALSFLFYSPWQLLTYFEMNETNGGYLFFHSTCSWSTVMWSFKTGSNFVPSSIKSRKLLLSGVHKVLEFPLKAKLLASLHDSHTTIHL